jgi:hypothetical protein
MAGTMLETLRRHLAAEAVHDAATAASTYVPDGYYENLGLGLRFEGQDMVELQYAVSYASIIDMKATYAWEQVFGDVVVQCGRISGTAASEMFGVPSAGGTLDFPFTAVLSFRDGVMVGEHVYFELADVCAQAGLDLKAVRASIDAMRSSLVS